ncbi:hypothetical protein BJ170DRAFT_715375 [Xylariales sp. AK1849]|nr:hypothetical protein BJ170DRAFT_715375 [Xylariales sp. AK1849]
MKSSYLCQSLAIFLAFRVLALPRESTDAVSTTNLPAPSATPDVANPAAASGNPDTSYVLDCGSRPMTRYCAQDCQTHCDEHGWLTSRCTSYAQVCECTPYNQICHPACGEEDVKTFLGAAYDPTKTYKVARKDGQVLNVVVDEDTADVVSVKK